VKQLRLSWLKRLACAHADDVLEESNKNINNHKYQKIDLDSKTINYD
jgi:hypothetical protein